MESSMEVAENFNKEEIQMQTSQCTKVGENGEIITVSITTEESHQASVLGKNIQNHFKDLRCVKFNRTFSQNPRYYYSCKLLLSILPRHKSKLL